MAEKMKMSHNVAGVTLLALGNGAPGKLIFLMFDFYIIASNDCFELDIFSSLAGIRQGRAELAFGELFGIFFSFNFPPSII